MEPALDIGAPFLVIVGVITTRPFQIHIPKKYASFILIPVRMYEQQQFLRSIIPQANKPFFSKRSVNHRVQLELTRNLIGKSKLTGFCNPISRKYIKKKFNCLITESTVA